MSIDLERDIIVTVRAVDVTLDPSAHPFALEHEDEIAAYWQEITQEYPALFNGEVALLSRLGIDRDILVGRCHIVRYATFVYWRKLRAIAGAGHFYAHPMLVSSDGALIAVRMGKHTLNAGRVYFAAGSFEPADFRDGKADLERNMFREVLEETGLNLASAPHDDDYQILSKATGTVIFRRYFLDRTAEELVAEISAHVAGEAEPEIEGPVVIRNLRDLPENLAPQMPALIDWHFSRPASG